jgi:hypothetical protein
MISLSRASPTQLVASSEIIYGVIDHEVIIYQQTPQDRPLCPCHARDHLWS